MGDRANVVLTSTDNEGGDIVLYTHWRGYLVESIVQEGIAHALKTGRHTDGTYAQRIVVDTFFRAHADSYDDGTGAGIYVGQPNEPHVITVDFDTQSVTFDPNREEYGAQEGTVTETFDVFAARIFADA